MWDVTNSMRPSIIVQKNDSYAQQAWAFAPDGFPQKGVTIPIGSIGVSSFQAVDEDNTRHVLTSVNDELGQQHFSLWRPETPALPVVKKRHHFCNLLRIHHAVSIHLNNLTTNFSCR